VAGLPCYRLAALLPARPPHPPDLPAALLQRAQGLRAPQLCVRRSATRCSVVA